MAVDDLLLESGDSLLLEDGGRLILESSTVDRISGNAGFKWTPVGETQEVELVLPFPLKVDPAHSNRRQRESLDSLDFSTRDVVTAGGSADEYRAKARFVNRPQRLLEMLRDGQRVQLDYYTDVSDNTTKHEAWLLGGQDREIDNEAEDRGRAEWQVTLRLRAINKNAFDDLM